MLNVAQFPTHLYTNAIMQYFMAVVDIDIALLAEVIFNVRADALLYYSVLLGGYICFVFHGSSRTYVCVCGCLLSGTTSLEYYDVSSSLMKPKTKASSHLLDLRADAATTCHYLTV